MVEEKGEVKNGEVEEVWEVYKGEVEDVVGKTGR